MDFDPYYKWLAIPSKDQPPHHYRLLGLEKFENDSDVIANAADQRMMLVRSFQSSDRSALSQKLLNEIAAAKVCLLDLARKREYDSQLRQLLQQQPVTPAATATAMPRARRPGGAGTRPSVLRPQNKSRRRAVAWAAGGIMAIVMLAVMASALGLFSAPQSELSGGRPSEKAPASQVDNHTTASPAQPSPVTQNTSGVPANPPPVPRAAPIEPIRLRPISPQRLKQNALLRVQVEAENSNDASNRIRFLLGPSAPKGMLLDANSGVLTWTPTRDHRPNEYVVPIIAMLNDGKQQAQISFTVFVEQDDKGPEVLQLADQMVRLGERLRVDVAKAVQDTAAGKGKYALITGPPKAAVDELTGIFTWAPDEQDAGQEFEAKVRRVDERGHLCEAAFAIRVSGAGNAAFPPASPGDVKTATKPADKGAKLFARTLDEASSSARFTGDWSVNDKEPNRYGTSYRFARAQSGSSVEFQFADLPPGRYRVLATWLELENRTKKAPFIIDNGLKSSTHLVNQSLPPRADSTDGGRPFQILATVHVHRNCTVRLTSADDNYVIADAVRVERLPDGERVAVPTMAQQSKAKEQIRELFAEEFRAIAGQNAEQAKLAERLVLLARTTLNDPAARYTLYQQAAELSRVAGQSSQFVRIMDEWALFFEIDALGEIQSGLQNMAKSVRNDQAAKELAQTILQFIDELAAQDEWDRAGTLARLAVSVSNKAGDSNLHNESVQRQREVVQQKKLHDEFTKALESLKNNPQGGAANRTVGYYLAFIKGRWKEALPHLARCDDAKVAAVAKAELAAPAEADQKKKIADEWAAIAKGVDAEKSTTRFIDSSNEAKATINRHALLWYQNALPGLDGLAQKTVEMHIRELGALIESAHQPKPNQDLQKVLVNRRWGVRWRSGTIFRDVQFKADGAWSAIQVTGGRSVPIQSQWKIEGIRAMVPGQGFVDAYQLNGNDLVVERLNSRTKAVITSGEGSRQ